MRLGEFTTLLKLSAIRKKSVENYFRFQRYQASIIHRDLQKRGMQFSKRFLDIGSGIGGYVYEFSKKHENTDFYSLDLNPLPFAQEKYKGRKIFVVRGDATYSPFKDNSFDFVFASGVIEHVEDQEKLIHSISGMANENSLVYISFPPFYSPVGGHSISPLHYLPGNLPFYLYRTLYRQKHSSFKNYGLVKTTLRSAEDMIRKKFEILDIKPRFFESVKPLIKIPLVREVVAPHIEFFLRPEKNES